MAAYVIEGPAVLFYGTANCQANGYLPVVLEGDSPNANVLGITESGVSISTSLMTHRISTDVYGGTEGPPADLLVLGGQASLRGTLVKWAPNAINAMTSSLRGESPGFIPWPGKGVWNGGHGFAFWVVGSYKSYYFPRCELATQPREWNISALERKMPLNINAYSVLGTKTVGKTTTYITHIYYVASSDQETYQGQLGPTCVV